MSDEHTKKIKFEEGTHFGTGRSASEGEKKEGLAYVDRISLFDRGMIWPLPPLYLGSPRPISSRPIHPMEKDPYGSRDPDVPYLGPDFVHSCNHGPRCEVREAWECEACGPDFQALHRAYDAEEVDALDFFDREGDLIEQHKNHTGAVA